MGTLSIWFFLVGAVLTCRALSFAVIQWEMFSLRKTMCIERIVHEQRACDLLIAIYHSLVVCIGLWLMLLGGWEVFNDSIVPLILCATTPIILLILFIVYLLLRIYLNTGYGLTDFYNDMVSYRSKQEVVTKDNDNEVSYIRSYKRVRNQKWYACGWMFFIVVIMFYMT